MNQPLHTIRNYVLTGYSCKLSQANFSYKKNQVISGFYLSIKLSLLLWKNREKAVDNLLFGALIQTNPKKLSDDVLLD